MPDAAVQRHVFVCTTGYECHWPHVTAEHRAMARHLTPEQIAKRRAEAPEHSDGHVGLHCGEIGGGELYAQMKALFAERGIEDVFLSPNACVAQHIAGPVVMVYPDGVWYGRVQPEDLEEIVDSHLIEGKPVERLIWREVGDAPVPANA
jgi:(2Fe-2S) ferredoxin